MGDAYTDRTRRFDAIFRAHCPEIVAYCGWRAQPSIDAQDVVAEVFLAAWRRLDDVPDGDAARPVALRHGAPHHGEPPTVESPAGLVAPESGFKEGEHIRVFPFGYVAHDEASDPDAPVDVSITVGPDQVIRELRVAWGGASSVWTYTVTYTDLGTTPPLEAPANAEPFPERTPVAPAD